jgi:hypothetical protein
MRKAELNKLACDKDVLQSANLMDRLTCCLQDRHSKMPVRAFVMLVAFCSLLSGCADTKKASQSDSNSVLQQESDHEVHGEVGVMYGHTAR